MEFDDYVGQQVQEWRLEQGLTQEQLAERMTGHGFPMRQQTILKIEKGQRSLRLAEALAMAEILKFDVGMFQEPQPLAEQVMDLEDELGSAWQQVAAAIEEYATWRRYVTSMLEAIAKAGVDLTELPISDDMQDAGNPETLVRKVADAYVTAEERYESKRRAVYGTEGDSDTWLERIQEREEAIEIALRQHLEAKSATIARGRDGIDQEA